MSDKTPIKIKTDTEHLLYKAYSEEKAENENLRQIIQNMQTQIDNLQQQLKSLKQDIEVAEKNPVATTTESSIQCSEYCTDEDELAKETEWVRVKSRKSKKRKLNTSPTQNEPVTADGSPTKEKTKKIPPPPPIIVDGVENYQNFFDIISQNMSSDLFTTKIVNGKGVKINAKDVDSYKSATNFLNKSDYLWHSYENKQLRPIKVMVKNLHYTCQPARIIEDLQKKGFKIEDASNKLSWKKKEPLNMFMLTFNNSEDINNIYAIKHILGCKVEVHPIKTSKLVPQCKRCQAYGHTQKYCAKEPRCVKCTGKHLTRECKKPAEAKPKCVHCGDPHPANYRGCIVAKEMQNIRSKATKQRTTRPIQPNIQKDNNHRIISKNPNVHGQSYAKMTAPKAIETEASRPIQTQSNLEKKMDEVLKIMQSFDNRLKTIEYGAKDAVPKRLYK